VFACWNAFVGCLDFLHLADLFEPGFYLWIIVKGQTSKLVLDDPGIEMNIDGAETSW